MEEVIVSDVSINMSSVISAGILLQYEDKFLIGHPTELSGTTNGWGILKGKMDAGEKLFDTALREFQEESNFDIAKAIDEGKIRCFPRPFYSYKSNNKKKTIYVFWMQDVAGFVYSAKLSCPSLIPETNKPEIDKYKWVTASEAIDLVVPSQKDLFQTVKNLTALK